MKERTVDEKKYDPQSSQQLAQWNPAELRGGFRHETETLFKTVDGDFFILHEGGLFSRFHTLPEVVNWYGGIVIQPVSREEAVAWCEETGNYEVIERHIKIFNPGYRKIPL